MAESGLQNSWQRVASKIHGREWPPKFMAESGLQNSWQRVASKIHSKERPPNFMARATSKAGSSTGVEAS
eukprot:5666200-Pleurochrysis_carterae.AAC.2